MRVAARQAHFHTQPLALLAAAYAAGVLLAHARAPSLRWALAGGALCFITAAVALVHHRLICATLFVCAAFMCAGLALSLVEQRSTGADRVRRLYDDGLIGADEPLEVTGVLARAPEVAPDGLYLAFRVEQVKRKMRDVTATGTLELFAPARDAAARGAYDELELRRGARVRVLVALEREEAFHNPGGSALTEFLARRGFDAVGTIKSPLLVERLDDERVLLPLVWLDAWREWMRARMAQMFSVETAGVLQAALLGNRYGLSRATAERFRAGGTFHVLVISGLHISFVAWLAFTLLRFVTRRRAGQFAATVLLLWAYAVAVGAGASVVRAALMFTLVALAPLVSRRANSLNVLGGVALALLSWRPDDLFDPSFQLTFMSVVGIITLGWPLLERLRMVGAWRPTRATPYPPRCPRWFRMLGELLYWRASVWRREQTRTIYSYRLFKNPLAARLERWHVQALLRHACAAVLISASVQLCLLPLLVIYFHRVSAAALVLNIFVGLLMAALALSALTALALSCVSLRLTHPFVGLGERLNWLMTHSVDPFARAHIASLRLPAYHGRAALIYVLYYLTLAVMLIMLARWQPLAPPFEGEVRATTATAERRALGGRNRHKTTRGLTLAGLTLIALLSVISAHPLSAGRADGRLRIDFLDVGQGDAALVTMPDSTTLLVDGGGRPLLNQPKRNVADWRTSPPADNDPTMADNEEPKASFARDARSIGDAVVSEYLWWRGLDHIDYLLATHAHADHVLFNAKIILDSVSV
jgi:competence protein ComEC